MTNVVYVVLGLMVVVAVNVWAAGMDKERSNAADNYKQCVVREYGMTPTQWYEQHNQYPLCGN